MRNGAFAKYILDICPTLYEPSNCGLLARLGYSAPERQSCFSSYAYCLITTTLGVYYTVNTIATHCIPRCRLLADPRRFDKKGVGAAHYVEMVHQ